MKDIGILGAPYAGKSTLFTALTRAGAAGGRSNQAVVPVADTRLEVLSRLEGSARIVAAQVRFVDVPGGTSAQGLAALRETDALCLVLRAFGADADPAAELTSVTTDLIFADLVNVESALAGAQKRSKGRAPADATETLRALERALEALSDETLLRDASLEEEELRELRSLAPLTLKPWVVVANMQEGGSLPAGLPSGTLGISAALEAETASMPRGEA
ncbi:MAG: 50S ribosome-binding GTPase, partial [Actinobacteria bacterium]|nr:50S ribosome-binding GTPase [Actinomycetota bacterium]